MRKTLGTWLSGMVLLLGLTAPAQAELQSREVPYQDGDVKLAGYLVWDDAITGKRPGVLVVHEWWGLNDYAKKRAEMLAKMGYIAFAADMYGVGHVTTHGDEAGAWMKQITANIDLWQHRANLALDALKSSPETDPGKLAAIGYCFGGATVMQLAYSGADVKGVVSFHGSMPPATPEQAARIHAKVLVEHGAADGFIPPERLTAFQKALEDAKVDWRMTAHGGAVHGFTNPDAGKANMPGVAYDEKADRRSWQEMQEFFKELFN